MPGRDPPVDNSHFVPYQVINEFHNQRPGPDYSDATHAAIEKCFNSAYNTSETSVSFNRGLNKSHENQITDYAKGNIGWSDMTAGAQNRYFQQAEAWKDVKAETNIKESAPGLTNQLDNFYNPRNKHW